MSASDNSNATFFCWKIVDFCKQRKNSKPYGLTSDSFSLKTRPSFKFVLKVSPPYRPRLCFKNSIKVILSQFDGKSLDASVTIWAQSVGGQIFGEASVERHVFSQIADQFGYDGLSGKKRSEFEKLYFNHETFYIYCKIVDLNPPPKFPTVNCDQAFYRNQLALYEDEQFSDAIVKVGKAEFKVSKFVFASQSLVFKAMFLSNFREGRTNTIELKDIEENTVKHLIKWLYTNKLESDAPIEKLFYAADKYDIKLLKDICAQLMTNSLSSENAFSRLVLATLYNDDSLKAQALESIGSLSKNDLSKVLLSDEWTKFNVKHPEMAKGIKELIRNKLE